jgi:hypothetical protein
MGIKGLSKYIKQNIPGARKSVQWKESRGTRWGIDCLCIMFKARGAGLSPITTLASIIVRMREWDIEPIVIFDGKAPQSKFVTTEQRRKVRSVATTEMNEIKEKLKTEESITIRSNLEHRHSSLQRRAPQISSNDRNDIKQFLHASGTRFVTALEEADDVLSYLCRTGFIQAVISSDMDMLARGVPRLIHPETPDASVLTEISLSDVLEGVKLDYSQFVEACVLMGTDYSIRVTMNPHSALESVRFKKMSEEKNESEIAKLKGEDVVWEDIISEFHRTKWDSTILTPEPDTLQKMSELYNWPIVWATKLC